MADWPLRVKASISGQVDVSPSCASREPSERAECLCICQHPQTVFANENWYRHLVHPMLAGDCGEEPPGMVRILQWGLKRSELLSQNHGARTGYVSKCLDPKPGAFAFLSISPI